MQTAWKRDMGRAESRAKPSLEDEADTRLSRPALVAWVVVWLVSLAGLITLFVIGPY